MKKVTYKILYSLCCWLWLFGIRMVGLSAKEVASEKKATKMAISPRIIRSAQQSSVTVGVCSSLTAYSMPLNCSGHGVVVDKEQGFILTSSWLAGRGVVASYTVTFYNGEQVEAKVLYCDPLVDYAFLKVNPAAIPKKISAVKFSKEPPVIDQPGFLFSLDEHNHKKTAHMVRVSDLYYTDEPISQASIVASRDTKGMVHGSPIWNQQGEVIGLVYASSDTMVAGLYTNYMRYALSFLQKGSTPVRRHIGALLEMYSLADAEQYDQFPEAQQKIYREKFPLARNHVLSVVSTLQGTPANQHLLSGDIIWKVDGLLCGPNLVDFDHYMNTTTKPELQLTIFRKGAFHDITIPLYDLEAAKIKRMVQFGGATFFEIDHVCSRFGGEPAGTLTLCTAKPNTIFTPIMHVDMQDHWFFCIKLLACDGKPITTLDDLIAAIPVLIAKKYFTIEYINHLSISSRNSVLVGYDRYKVNIGYDTNMPEPLLFTLDATKMEWIARSIVQNQ